MGDPKGSMAERQDRNFIVKNCFFQETDIDLFFGPIEETDVFEELAGTETIFDLLVLCGIFSSKSQARKNWNRGGLEKGWNDFERIGKLNHRICVLVPFN